MCVHYRYEHQKADHDELVSKFDFRNFETLKDCLLAIEPEIRKYKQMSKQLRRDGTCPAKIDYRKNRLSFAAWVLNVSRSDEKKGKNPWLNGGHLFI